MCKAVLNCTTMRSDDSYIVPCALVLSVTEHHNYLTSCPEEKEIYEHYHGLVTCLRLRDLEANAIGVRQTPLFQSECS
jgi:hypothetical protein